MISSNKIKLKTQARDLSPAWVLCIIYLITHWAGSYTWVPLPTRYRFCGGNRKIFERPDEWQTPSVGAMKIARNLPVSEWHVEWYPPHPGSLSEGAVSEAD